MLFGTQSWEKWHLVIIYILVCIEPISSQGLACYKCMTVNQENSGCADPFSSLVNPVQINCQVNFLFVVLNAIIFSPM